MTTTSFRETGSNDMTVNYKPLWPLVEEVILDRQPHGFRGPRKQDGWLTYHSPLRDDDQNPSFSVRPDSADNAGGFKDHATDENGSMAALAQLLGIDPHISTAKQEDSGSGSGKVVDTYDYCDMDGTVLYQVVRTEPKQFKARRRNANGGWDNNTKGVKRVLYHLDEVASAHPTREIVFVEGEKDVDRLRDHGFVATCNPFGAKSWKGTDADSYSGALLGRHVVIIPDNDDPGRDLALKVATSLQGKAASIKIVDLPNLPSKGDVSDWLDAGGSAVELQRIFDKAPFWGAEQSEPWAEPTPLMRHTLGVFPLASLPYTLRTYTQQLCRQLQIPACFVGMVVLSVIATTVAKKVRVRARDGWTEPTNIYTMPVLPPATRKSPAMDHATKPIVDFERERRKDMSDEIREDQMKYDLTKGRLDALKKKAIEAKSDADFKEESRKAMEMDAELAKCIVPPEFRLLADNVTPEKLITLMFRHDGKMSVLSPEGGELINIVKGRYSNGDNQGAFLLAHGGDRIVVDRSSREEIIEDPALTLCLGAQPAVIDNLKSSEEVGNRGLLERFLYTVPRSPLGHRKRGARAVEPAVYREYQMMVRKLLELAPPQSDGFGDEATHLLVLSPEAQDLFDDFEYDYIEPNIGEFMDFEVVAGWAGKLSGAVARIAGLLHMAEHCDSKDPTSIPISARTMGKAIAIGQYLIPHAMAAFARMNRQTFTRGGNLLLRWIQKEGLAEFSQRDAHHALQHHFPTVESLQPAINKLVDHGYIRPKGMVGAEKREGRPSLLFEVNPLTPADDDPMPVLEFNDQDDYFEDGEFMPA